MCWQRKLTPSIGCNRSAYKVDMEVLKNDVEKFPDEYQCERAKRLNVGQPAIHYALKRLNISLKKRSDTRKSVTMQGKLSATK